MTTPHCMASEVIDTTCPKPPTHIDELGRTFCSFHAKIFSMAETVLTHAFDLEPVLIRPIAEPPHVAQLTFTSVEIRYIILALSILGAVHSSEPEAAVATLRRFRSLIDATGAEPWDKMFARIYATVTSAWPELHIPEPK